MSTMLRATLRAAPLALSLTFVMAAPAHADAVARARHYLAQSKPRDAILVLRGALRDHPDNGPANFMLAGLDLQLGSPVSAEREARAARDAHYQPDRALTLILNAYLAQRRYVDLLHDFPIGTATGDTAARIAVGRASAERALDRAPEADANIAKARTFDPKLPAVWLAGAGAASAKGDTATAQADIAKAKALAPDNPDVQLAEARAAMAAGKPADAVAILKSLVAHDPSNMDARVTLADALVGSGDRPAAQAEITKILAITPGSVGALYLQAGIDVSQRKWKAAQVILQKLSPVISDLPGAYFLQAETLLHLGEFGAAQQDAQHYVAKVPSDPRGHRLLAALALKNGHPHQALAALKAVGAGDRTDAGAAMLEGGAEQALGNLAQAKAAFARAATLAPKSPAPLVRLAGIDLATGQPAAAVVHLKQASALAPKDPHIATALAQAAIAANDRPAAKAAIAQLDTIGGAGTGALLSAELDLAAFDLPAAAKDYHAALKADPHNVAALLGLAHVALLRGDTAKAQDFTARAVKIDPGNQPAVSALALLLAHSKNFDQTASVLEAAHKASPDNPVFVADLVSLDLRIKKPDDARSLLAGVSPNLATNPTILAAKAQLALADHDSAGAKTDLQALIQHDPKNPGAVLALARLDVANKDMTGAQAALTQGLAASPHDLLLLQADVGLAFKQGGMAGALAKAKKLAADPSHRPESTLLPGRLYAAQHQPDQAIAAFESARQTTPSALLALSLGTAQAMAGKPDDAKKTLDDAIARFGNLPALQDAAGQVDLGKHDLAGAAAHYRSALARAPNDIEALNNLAWISGKQGDKDAAGLAARAYAISPTPQIADTLGWILAGQSKSGEAKILLAQAHRGMPGDPSVAYHYAAVLARTGDKAKAAAILKPILASKTNFADRDAAEKLDASLSKT